MTNVTKAEGRWVNATITRVERRTSNVVSLFVAADIPPYEAGQHVDIRLSAPDGYQAQRSYSIASAPGAVEIELIVERMDDGEVSPYFHDVVQPGDTFELRGPIGGHFVWAPEFTDPVLLVAAGSGAAPLISILRHHRNSGAGSPMLLLYSARTWDDVICREELLAADVSDPGVSLVLTLTRDESPRSDDFGRRIDALLVQDVLRSWGESPGRVYVCGSNDFVDAATDALIASAVPPGIIRTERYG
jgi:ferredoxin-NADP reductase